MTRAPSGSDGAGDAANHLENIGENCADAESLPQAPDNGNSGAPIDGAARYANGHDPHTLTVLEADAPRTPLTKLWQRNEAGEPEKKSYRKAFRFRHHTRTVNGIRELGDLLAKMERFKWACIIRGALRREWCESETPEVLRRLIRKPPNPQAPRGSKDSVEQPAYFEPAERGRQWLCLDIDNLHIPASIDAAANPLDAVRFAVSRLPERFHGATCWFQWSASMGMGKNPWGKIKLHVWYWLVAPIRCAHLKAWAKSLAPKLIDDALFSPVQVHYTAAAEFAGVIDPFGEDMGRARSGFLDGERDDVDLWPIVEPIAHEHDMAERARLEAAQRRAEAARERAERNHGESVDTANRDGAAGWDGLSRRTQNFLACGAVEGERNSELFAAARDLAGCGISVDEATPELLAAAGKCSPPMELESVEATIQSAYSRNSRPAREFAARGNSTGDAGGELGTELWFARLLVEHHGEDLRFVGPWQRWMVWDGIRWRNDETGEVMRRAVRVQDEVVKPLAHHLLAIAGDDSEAKFANALAKRFESKMSLQNAVALAAVDARVVATIDQWDANPWALNCANGIIDLRTGTLRPHDRAAYCTKLAPVEFVPDALSPVWQRAIESTLPDIDVREYVQTFAGYAATGEVREHSVDFWWGGGCNGKSTTVEALRAVLGDYATTIPTTVLLATKGDRHPTDIATLHGVRLAVASELPEGGRLNEQQVKALTGGDTITARRMREDYWVFTPTHKLLVLTNHLPQIRGTDAGIWRRVRLVPFTLNFETAGTIDRELPERLRQPDASRGILAWVVTGAVRYAQEGLTPPETVKAATAEYRTDEDVLGAWLAECVDTGAGPSAFISGEELHQSYLAWCDREGIQRPLTRRVLGKRLRERGFIERNKGGRTRGFAGVALAKVHDDFSSCSGFPPIRTPAQENWDSENGNAKTPSNPPSHNANPAMTKNRHADAPDDAEIF